jgi:hypothetical protein
LKRHSIVIILRIAYLRLLLLPLLLLLQTVACLMPSAFP